MSQLAGDPPGSTPGWLECRSLLAVRLDSMGDVLMTSPALRALKQSPARPRVTLLTSPAGEEAARLIPEVDQVLVYEAPWMKATAGRSDPGPDRAMIDQLAGAGFDGAVIFTVYSQSPLPAALLCHLAGIPLRLAHCRENPYQLLSHWVRETDPGSPVRHEVRRQLDLVATVGMRPDRVGLSVTLPPGAAERVAELLAGLLEPRPGPEGPLVVIHPGASAPSRRYPAVGFATAARQLAGSGCRIVFTGSAAEQDLVAGIQAATGSGSVSLAGQLNLAELGGLLARAAVLIANNTGPVHLAAALGTPVVDLYALTNPQHTPWEVPSRVLFQDVACRWCYKSVCPEVHHHCLALVEPKAIVSAVSELRNGVPLPELEPTT